MARSTPDLATLILRQQRSAMQELLGRARQRLARPEPGSPFAADWDWCARQDDAGALHAIMAQAGDDVAQILCVADEHAQGITVLVAAEAILPLPAVSLQRSVHEALLTVCWVVDPTLTTQERLARCAAITLSSAQDGAKALEQVPSLAADVKEAETVREAVAGMQTYLTNHGFTLDYGRGADTTRALGVSFGDAKASLKLNVTDAGRKYMRGSNWLWSVASGATHSRNWFTASLEGSRDQLAVMVTYPLLDFCDAVARDVGCYMGLPVDRFHGKAHLRRQALLARTEHYGPAIAVADYAQYAETRDAVD